MKLDMYGNVEWENTYNLMDYWGNRTVIQTSDGGYLFAGWVGIVKVDSLGNKEWKNQNHPAGMGNYPYYEDIIEHSNGKYYAVGGPGNGGLALMVKFSRDGQVLKRKWYGGNCDNDRFKSVVESHDGRLIAVGAKVHGNSGYPCSFEWYDDFWIVKLGVNGAKFWEKTYGGAYYEEAHDIVRIETGGYAIIGEKCPDTPSHCTNATRVMYLEIDNGGNQVSSNIFNRNGFCSGHAITTTHDGGIAWVGERGNYNLWMYQWDSNNQPLDYLVPALIKKLSNKRNKKIILKDLNHYRDFIKIIKIIKIIKFLHRKKFTGIINIGSGKKIYLKKIVKKLNKYNVKVEFKDGKKMNSLVADISKLRRLGYKDKNLSPF